MVKQLFLCYRLRMFLLSGLIKPGLKKPNQMCFIRLNQLDGFCGFQLLEGALLDTVHIK